MCQLRFWYCRVSARQPTLFCFGKSGQNHVGCALAPRLRGGKLFGFPARFAGSFGLAQDRSGGAQTRCAQTMCALFPVSAALLGHTTRPVETPETVQPFFMEDQLAELVLSFVEGLKQGLPVICSVRPQGPTSKASGRRKEILPCYGPVCCPKLCSNCRFRTIYSHDCQSHELPGFAPAGELVAWRVPKSAYCFGATRRAQPL